MGHGRYDIGAYTKRATHLASSGYKTAFTHDEDIRHGRRAMGVHETLDPKLKAGDGSPHAGQVMRECMVTEEHPNPTPIAVLFDVTGSMRELPALLQQKLPQLHGLLQRKGYCDSPEILFGAIGDAYSDRVPLQVGQFESGNAMDENIGNIFLEGGGGGSIQESYALGAYFLARHTYLEPFERDGSKGYAFFIGDEQCYERITRKEIAEVIGDDDLQGDPETRSIFEELQERYEVFFLYAEEGSYSKEQIIDGESRSIGRGLGWRELLGERALTLDSAAAVCETIALTIGVMEGTVSLDEGLADLKEIGSDLTSVAAAGKALATVSGGAVAVADGEGELPGLDDE